MRKWKEGGREKKETGGWRGERREGIERGEEGRGRTREEGGLSVICETKTRALPLAMNYRRSGNFRVKNNSRENFSR